MHSLPEMLEQTVVWEEMPCILLMMVQVLRTCFANILTDGLLTIRLIRMYSILVCHGNNANQNNMKPAHGVERCQFPASETVDYCLTTPEEVD